MDNNDENLDVLAEGKFLRLLNWQGWEYLERVTAVHAVVIVAVTPERKLLFVEQYRPPVRKNCIELPAGLVGDVEGEEHTHIEEAAKRELIEETGYDCESFEYLTEGPPSPGQSNENVVLLLARNLRQVGMGGGVDDEKIIVHEVPLDEVESFLKGQLKAGKAVDPKTYAGLHFALAR